MRLLKFGIIGIVAVVAAAFIAGTPRDGGGPQQAEAGPVAIQGLNSSICVTLGVAFGGLQGVDAIKFCGNVSDQNATNEGMQSFLRCLRGSDVLKEDPPGSGTLVPGRDGVQDCVSATDDTHPLYDPEIQQATPEDFAPLDRDANQIHPGQQLLVFVYVDDDAPVRFTTNEGFLLGVDGSFEGKDYFCETSIDGVEGDPDCDNDPSTPGDGIVAATLAIDNDTEPGTYTVTAVQEGIGFPMDFTVVGTPKRIELQPLFGKTVISTGATAPTGSLDTDEDGNGFLDKFDPPLPTACDFGATASAVLGANSDPEKVIIVAKVFDDDDNEIIGSLLRWESPFVMPASNPDGFFKDSDMAGVSLPATPMLDTGPLGFGFPQFLCGKTEPGVHTIRAEFSFGEGLDPQAKPTARGEVDITVVGPGENISLGAEPASVDCSGTNSATVTASVTTADGENAANGTDVEWSVQALGTANPLVSDTTDGKATTVVTPLSGATSGVVVVATVGDDQASVLVNCAPGTGTIPPAGQPAPGGGAGGSGGRPGTITGPDTGSGGDLDGTGALSIWPAIALFTAAMGLVGARYAIRRA